jgi:hypothetical protein
MTKEKFKYQFSVQLRAFVRLANDPEDRCFIIDGNRLGVDDVLEMLFGESMTERTNDIPLSNDRRAIIETVSDDILPGETAARMQSIFEGTPGEQAGRRWIDSEMSDPAYTEGTAIEGLEGRFYHKMIHEPEHGAELPCFWDSNTKAWMPDYPWPPVLPQADYPDNEEREE